MGSMCDVMVCPRYKMLLLKNTVGTEILMACKMNWKINKNIGSICIGKKHYNSG